MADFKRGDMVQHKDGRTGMVERCTGTKVTVQFENHWRSSVVNAENITLTPTPEGDSRP